MGRSGQRVGTVRQDAVAVVAQPVVAEQRVRPARVVDARQRDRPGECEPNAADAGVRRDLGACVEGSPGARQIDRRAVDQRPDVGVGRRAAGIHPREARHRDVPVAGAGHGEPHRRGGQRFPGRVRVRVRPHGQGVAAVRQPGRPVVAGGQLAEQRVGGAAVHDPPLVARSRQGETRTPDRRPGRHIGTDADHAADGGQVEGRAVRHRSDVRVRRPAARVDQRERRVAGNPARHGERDRARRQFGAARLVTREHRRGQRVGPVRQPAGPMAAPPVQPEQREGCHVRRPNQGPQTREREPDAARRPGHVGADVDPAGRARDIHHAAVGHRSQLPPRGIVPRVDQREAGDRRFDTGVRHHERHFVDRQQHAVTAATAVRRRLHPVRAGHQPSDAVVAVPVVAEQREGRRRVLHPRRGQGAAQLEAHAADRIRVHHVGSRPASTCSGCGITSMPRRSSSVRCTATRSGCPAKTPGGNVGGSAISTVSPPSS